MCEEVTEDPITHLEAGGLLPHRLDHAGGVDPDAMATRPPQTRRDAQELPARQHFVKVGAVDARCLDAHQHLLAGRRWFIDLPHVHDPLRRSIRISQRGFHPRYCRAGLRKFARPCHLLVLGAFHEIGTEGEVFRERPLP